MQKQTVAYRIRISVFSFILAGIFFVLYPAIRPFSDEASLEGAAAFASTGWLVAHTLAILAFTLLPLGLYGILTSLKETDSERQAYWAFVLSLLGVSLTLPFYGAETFGLRSIGQEAVRQQNPALLELAGAVRSGAGLAIFIVGLLLLAIAAILVAIVLWRSGKYPKWSGVSFALGILLFIPQFFWTQPLRVAHGLLVAIGCLWIAAVLWRHNENGLKL